MSYSSIYFCNGFIAYHNNFYLVVKGQVPLQKAIDLHENYNSDKLAIRVNSNCMNPDPTFINSENDQVSEYASDLFKKRKKGERCDIIDKKCNDLRDKFIEDSPESFYISLYHIDTWDGFKVFTKFIMSNKIQSTWFQ